MAFNVMDNSFATGTTSNRKFTPQTNSLEITYWAMIRKNTLYIIAEVIIICTLVGAFE